MVGVLEAQQPMVRDHHIIEAMIFLGPAAGSNFSFRFYWRTYNCRICHSLVLRDVLDRALTFILWRWGDLSL